MKFVAMWRKMFMTKTESKQFNTTVLFDLDVLAMIDELVTEREREHGKPSRKINRGAILNELIRSILPVNAPQQIPVLGTVAAGGGILADGNIEDTLALPAWMSTRAEFALRVRGDSMWPILADGDLVLVRKQVHAGSGDMVVAQRQDETGDSVASVKYFRTGKGYPELVSANPAYEPMRVAGEWSIIGRVVGAVRYMENGNLAPAWVMSDEFSTER